MSISDDLVARLLNTAEDAEIETSKVIRDYPSAIREAADRIEYITAERDAERARADRAGAERDEWKQASTRHHPNPADHRYWEGRYRDEKARAEAAEARVKELEGVLQEVHADSILLSLKKLTFYLQEWEHDPETMPKAYDQQPRHVQMLMDLIREHEEEKPYG